ncbi:hypothetical protein [Zavarzinella formosa]|nr:hypothetical protein [Zavarzinella formosa]
MKDITPHTWSFIQHTSPWLAGALLFCMIYEALCKQEFKGRGR